MRDARCEMRPTLNVPIAAMSLSNAGLSLSLVDQMSRQYTTCNLPTYRGFKQDRSCEYTPGTAEDIYHVVREQNYFRVRQLPSPLACSPPPIRCLLLCAPMGRLNVGAVPLNCFCTDSHALHSDPRHPKPYMNTALQTCAT